MSDHDDLTAGGHLDGNALAGPLGTVFASDVTVATAVCAGCGRAETIAALRVFGAPMGLIARCVGCDLVLLRYTELAGARTLDMTGMAALRLPPSEAPAKS